MRFIIFVLIILLTQGKRLWKLLTRRNDQIQDTVPVYRRDFSDDSYPGSRYHGCMVYGDRSLYLFGGVIYTPYSSDPIFYGDTWEYSLSRMQWRWIDSMEETNEANYPAYFGVHFNDINHPGARNGHNCVFYNHSMWFFGGIHVGVMRSDLWELSLVRKRQPQWKVIDVTGDRHTITGNSDSRSQNLRNDDNNKNNKQVPFGDGNVNGPNAVVGKYGFKRWKYRSYHPGSRTNYCLTSYKDSILMFGGFGFAKELITGWLADLWQYNITLERWRYLETGGNEHGIQAINSYLRKDEFGKGEDYPGSRDLSGCWTYADKLYLFSGRGYAMRENDLWMMDLLEDESEWEEEKSKFKWKFLGGERGLKAASEVAPNHGKVWDGTAFPGSREDFAVLPRGLVTLLFGGNGRSGKGGAGALGDLWAFHHRKQDWKWVDTLGDGDTLMGNSFEGKYSSDGNNVFHEHYYPGTRRSVMFASVAHKDLFFIYGGKRTLGRSKVKKVRAGEEEKDEKKKEIILGDFWVLGFACFGYSYEHKNVCSGNGICESENVCKCGNGYYGRNCELIECGDEL